MKDKNKKIGLKTKIENNIKTLTLKTDFYLGEIDSGFQTYYICVLTKCFNIERETDFLYQVVEFKSSKYKDGIYTTKFTVIDSIGWENIESIDKDIKNKNFRFLYERYDGDVQDDKEILKAAFKVFEPMRSKIKK